MSETFMRGFTAAMRWSSPDPPVMSDPAVDPTEKLWLSGEFRLDAPAPLARALGLPPHTPAGPLVLAAYVRWREAVVDRLTGDFAFVVWDARRRELFAARDHLGVNALYYRQIPDGIAVASTIDALAPSSPRPSDRAILEHLTGVGSAADETFIDGVLRLPAGHAFTARAECPPRPVRWFHPPPQVLRFADPREADALVHSRLRDAVAARLPSGAPAVIHVSGGLDSSSIACVADELTRAHATSAQPILVNAAFPGTAADESVYVDAVRRRVSIPCVGFDAMPRGGYRYQHELAHPDRSFQTEYARGWQRVARERGARVALSGFGGDELFFERGVFRDLLAHGRLRELVHEARLAPRYSTRSARFFLRDALAILAPPSWKRATRRLRTPLPPWIAPSLARLAAETAPPTADDERFTSRTQELTWRWLTAPKLARTMEIDRLAARRAGIELRYPFLDHRLVELVLSLPWELRIPSGRMKVVLRRALAGVLPPEIVDRDHVTAFDDVHDARVRADLPVVRAVLHDGPWHAERYVDRTAARALLTRFEASADHPDADLAHTLWDITTLELWLRALAENRSSP